MMRLCLIVIVCTTLGAAACGTNSETEQPGAAGDQPAAATAAEPDPAGDRRAATAGKRFSRVPPDQVDPQRREAAESFARSYEQTRAQGSFAPLGDEATEEVRTSLTVKKQEAAQQQITAAFGEFESLEYVEAWRANASPESTIYRFRATFTKGKPEIRVVHDEQGKVSGYWIKPWRDRGPAPPIVGLTPPWWPWRWPI